MGDVEADQGAHRERSTRPPASTGKAPVGPASNEFKAEARLCSGTPEE